MTLIQDVKTRLTKVCTYLNDIDPAADIDMGPLNGEGEEEAEGRGADEAEGEAVVVAQ
jgi:hypothetical protein